MIRSTISLLIVVFSMLAQVTWAAADVSVFRTTDENAPWHPTQIEQDSRGMIWISSWNGLYRFDGYRFQSFKPEPGQGSYLDNERIRGILMVGGDSLLCRLDEGVFLFNVRTCLFDTLPATQQSAMQLRMDRANTAFSPTRDFTIDGQDYPDIQQRFQDQQGNIWLRSAESIYCLHANQRHGKAIDSASQQDIPRCLFHDSQGNFWVCSRDNRQVALYDADWNRLGYLGRDGQLHAQPVDFAAIYCIYDDARGTLWLGSKADGLFRLFRRDKGFDVQPIPMAPGGLPTNAIYDIRVDRLGTLWLATWDSGIICLDNPAEPNPHSLHYIVLNQHCPDYPADALKTRRILIRPDGTLLATSTRGLLIIDDIYTSLSQYRMHLHRREADRRTSLTASALMAVAFDAADRLFIATESGGVNVVEGQNLHADTLSFRHFTAREGLTSDVTFDFATGSDGRRVLVLCANGVSVLDVEHNQVESYGSQFWNCPSAFTECLPQVIGDSVLILTHQNGIMSLPVRELTQQGFSPYLALTSVTIGSEPTRYDVDHCDTLLLSPTQRSLVISYAALDLRSNRSLRYRTRLTEVGEEPSPWSRAIDTHEVILQDLHPGTYELQICSSNAQGQWPDNVRTITLIVQPRFFQSWYGQLLLWVLFAAVIASITFLIVHIRHIEAQRHELLETYLTLLDNTTKAQIAAAAQANATQNSQASDLAVPAATVEPADVTPVEYSAIPQHLTVTERQFMERLMEYVEANISNCNASLSDMAEATLTSKSSLTRKTHQLLGVTPADFLKEARLKHARQLLLTTSQPLADIALACGFSDPKYFSKCFKASTGKTPTEFRS